MTNKLNKKATVPKREYIRHLIRQEQKREEQNRLEYLLLEGLESGELIEINEQWWENKRMELLFYR